MDNEIIFTQNKNVRYSIDSSNSSGDSLVFRNTSRSNLWRPRSLISLVSSPKKKKSFISTFGSTDSIASNSPIDSVPNDRITNKFRRDKGAWTGIVVNVVVVEAKGLPDFPDDGATHSVYCKLRLGAETYKSKSVAAIHNPEWRERFKLHLYNDHLLRISLWDRGKQKNFMGSCVLDLSSMERERAHEVWYDLDDGYGSVHLSITLCVVSNTAVAHRSIVSVDNTWEKYDFVNFNSDWKLVGELHVKVIQAKGLNSKPAAYCTLEIDNEMLQTPNAKASTEPSWNKNFVFNIYDVTSTLDLIVYDSSLLNPLRNEPVGRVSIPLLRIRNEELRWYALKDKSKRNLARGNCPRILLEMSVYWNPLKAAVRLFQPREVKHIPKPPKFDLNLVYNNLNFVRDTFLVLQEINEVFKRLFEWENQELSFMALMGWLLFWYHFELWTAPLLLLLPFIYHWNFHRNKHMTSFMRVYSRTVSDGETQDSDKTEIGLSGKILGLQDTTLTITKGVEYLASLSERLYNLSSFKVPFLSYIAMLFLVISSIVLYWIPFRYLMMALGVYKFTRKYINPRRVLNNDLLDFMSRVPDNEILKDWRELNVPEPAPQVSRPTSFQNN